MPTTPHSLKATAEADFPLVADRATGQGQQFVGEVATDRVGQERVSSSYSRMERAFVTWHLTGCMNAAAAYHKARQAWELALMEGAS